MKKIILSLLLIAGVTTAFAQKFNPTLKDGTTMFSTVYMGDQQIPVLLTLQKSTDPVTLKWEVDGFGEGSFKMTAKAVASATRAFQGQPAQGVTELGDTELFGLISRDAYKSMVTNKWFNYNGTKFTVKTDAPAIKLNGKEADVTHVVSEDGKTQVWVLNNEALPLLIQTMGTGMDIVISEIK